MKKELVLTDDDLLIMNLTHYFVTELNYSPVILHGIDDEIWLENMTSEYKIVRIVGHYIHNNEQLRLDKFKLSQILKRLKAKTLSFQMNTLNIYTNLGDNVTLDNENNKGFYDILVEKIADVNAPNIIEMFPDIVEKTNYKEEGLELFLKISQDMNKTNNEKTEKMSKIFNPRRPIVTYFLMVVCVLAFGGMYIWGEGSLHVKTLVNFGALVSDYVKAGQFYRLVTSLFLHIGIFHLIANMYSLYVIGPQLENFYGKVKYLFIYVVSGIAGGMLAMAFSNNAIIAGASGCIFGLLGALLYFGYYYRVYLGTVIKSQIIPIILFNIFLGMVVEGISLPAHIGGLIGGVFSAMAVGVPEKSDKASRINGVILLIIYMVFLVYLVFGK